MTDAGQPRRFEHDDFVALVHQHRSKVEELRLRLSEDGAEEELLAVLSELDVAHEELRVGEEELATQRRHIDELVAESRDPRAWRERVVGQLPVAVLVTDPRGVVLDANAVAADLLGLRRVHLLRKPLALFVDESARSTFRGYLSDLVAHGTDIRCTLHVTPGAGSPFRRSSSARWRRVSTRVSTRFAGCSYPPRSRRRPRARTPVRWRRRTPSPSCAG